MENKSINLQIGIKNKNSVIMQFGGKYDRRQKSCYC